VKLPWYHGWNILAVGMVFQAVSFGIGIYCFTFWVAPWSREFDVGRSQVMTVFLTMQVAMGALAPFAGRAIDRVSIRGLVIAGTLSLALALALAARAGALWQLNLLYGTLVVAGMLLAGPLAAQTLAARWFVRRRGLALGVSTIGTSLGGFALPPLVTSLQADLGWRDANDVLAVLVVVVVVPLAWLTIRNAPPAVEGTSPVRAPAAASESFERLHHVLRHRDFWLLVLAFTPMATAVGAAQQNLAPFASDFGTSPQATASLVSTMALAMVAAKVFFGAMADRWDVRWLFCLAVAVLVVALAMMIGDVGYTRLLVACTLLGIAAGGFLPLLAAVVSTRFSISAFGQVMGMVGPFTTLAALGPWFAGYVRDTTGSYDTAWIIFALLMAPAMFAMALLRPRPVPVAA
jgi:MFS family permease